jgi:hypothetical protein
MPKKLGDNAHLPRCSTGLPFWGFNDVRPYKNGSGIGFSFWEWIEIPGAVGMQGSAIAQMAAGKGKEQQGSVAGSCFDGM